MITIIPTPKICNEKEGKMLTLIPAIYTQNKDLEELCKTFAEDFYKMTDCNLEFKKGGIELIYDASLRADGYTIDCTETGIILSASAKEGMIYALSSLAQLLTTIDGVTTCPQAHIEDYPDKEYRSLMIDLGRQWHPARTLYKYIDACYMYKVKYLHLHFCDTKLYTFPSKAFPKLNKPGKFYTDEEIASLNAYAKKRGVILIPEFECPGHAPILVNAYPEVFANDFSLASIDKVTYNEAGVKISKDSLVCAGSEKSFEGVKTLIKEICDLFPDAPYINIGGDEAHITLWNLCECCKEYMRKNGISDVKSLYVDYLTRITNYVISLGKTPMVWEGFSDDYAHRIPKETIVIVWESFYNTAPKLLEKGFKIVNASWKPLYLVPTQRAAKATSWDIYDILNWNVYNWQNWNPVSEAFLNPITVQPTENVIGSMYCSWEQTYEQEISGIMEKLGATSERTWTTKRLINNDDFMFKRNRAYAKLARLLQDL